MSYILRTIYNAEVVIDDNCGISKFYKVADLLQKDLSIDFINQIDNIENLDWDFQYKQQPLSLHFDIYGGISIKSKADSAKNCLVSKELGDYLHSKVY